MSERPYQPYYKPYGMGDEEYDYERRLALRRLEEWEYEQYLLEAEEQEIKRSVIDGDLIIDIS